jgi:hypothetical protein
VTLIKSAAFVAIEAGSFGRPKTNIWEDPVGSLLTCVGNGWQHSKERAALGAPQLLVACQKQNAKKVEK